MESKRWLQMVTVNHHFLAVYWAPHIFKMIGTVYIFFSPSKNQRKMSTAFESHWGSWEITQLVPCQPTHRRCCGPRALLLLASPRCVTVDTSLQSLETSWASTAVLPASGRGIQVENLTPWHCCCAKPFVVPSFNFNILRNVGSDLWLKHFI